jgi:hypothetical protein
MDSDQNSLQTEIQPEIQPEILDFLCNTDVGRLAFGEVDGEETGA